MTSTSLKGKLNEIASRIVELLARKDSDYGSENLRKHGLYGILVRLDDKLARLNHLISKKGLVSANVIDETLEDTFIDIAGYAINALRLLNEEKLQRGDTSCVEAI